MSTCMVHIAMHELAATDSQHVVFQRLRYIEGGGAGGGMMASSHGPLALAIFVIGGSSQGYGAGCVITTGWPPRKYLV